MYSLQFEDLLTRVKTINKLYKRPDEIKLTLKKIDESIDKLASWLKDFHSVKKSDCQKSIIGLMFFASDEAKILLANFLKGIKQNNTGYAFFSGVHSYECYKRVKSIDEIHLSTNEKYITLFKLYKDVEVIPEHITNQTIWNSRDNLLHLIKSKIANIKMTEEVEKKSRSSFNKTT